MVYDNQADQSNLINQARELLSPYVDGEVTQDERALVEQALAESPLIQAELEHLQQTIKLLQEMPRMPAPRPFTLTEADVGLQATSKSYAIFNWLKPFMGAVAVLMAVVVVGGLVWLNSSPFYSVSNESAVTDSDVTENQASADQVAMVAEPTIVSESEDNIADDTASKAEVLPAEASESAVEETDVVIETVEAAKMLVAEVTSTIAPLPTATVLPTSVSLPTTTLTDEGASVLVESPLHIATSELETEDGTTQNDEVQNQASGVYESEPEVEQTSISAMAESPAPRSMDNTEDMANSASGGGAESTLTDTTTPQQNPSLPPSSQDIETDADANTSDTVVQTDSDDSDFGDVEQRKDEQLVAEADGSEAGDTAELVTATTSLEDMPSTPSSTNLRWVIVGLVALVVIILIYFRFFKVPRN